MLQPHHRRRALRQSRSPDFHGCADAPLQVPKLWYDRYAHVDDEARRRYLAMVNWLDTAVGNVTDALRAREMYDSTLIVFSSGPQRLEFHSPGMLS